MNYHRVVLALLSGVVCTTPASAQRRLRFGPLVSTISIENGSAVASSYGGYGVTLALLTGDYDETGLVVFRYNDLSDNSCMRQVTFFGLNSSYYPIGARGIAPFASTELGLARVSEAQAPLLFTCTPSTPVETTSQLDLGFGLGLRVGVGNDAVGTVEGRFVQVPNSFVQGLEARANVSVAFGSVRQTELLSGTLGPAIALWIPISGPLKARAPLAGVRFRRDTKKAGSVGLEIDYAPLEVTGSCTNPGCEPDAVLFAPAYEPGLRPAWGRLYADFGLLIAGIPTEGPDRGTAQGLHAGLGADIFSGRVMWNINGRVVWLQRRSGESIFAVQVGASLSPRLGHPAPH
ncbi:MAG TPA: hypothetical protein VIW26_02865 [Gemmatimonadales bacterium]|jgi:hypothetical protein